MRARPHVRSEWHDCVRGSRARARFYADLLQASTFSLVIFAAPKSILMGPPPQLSFLNVLTCARPAGRTKLASALPDRRGLGGRFNLGAPKCPGGPASTRLCAWEVGCRPTVVFLLLLRLILFFSRARISRFVRAVSSSQLSHEKRLDMRACA